MKTHKQLKLEDYKSIQRCFVCGESRNGFLRIHHKTPKIFGGNDDPDNLAILCDRCHKIIHNTPQSQLSHSELTKIGIAKAKASRVLNTRGKDKNQRSSEGYINRYKKKRLFGGEV